MSKHHAAENPQAGDGARIGTVAEPVTSDSAERDGHDSSSAVGGAVSPEMICSDVPIKRVTAAPRSRMRKPMLVLAAAALCALTIGGGTVAAMDKKVSIVVDGASQHVSTMAGSVAGALAAAGISPNAHDAIAPTVDSPISDGSTIVVDRGRLLTLTIDGRQQQVWTTARTVDEALTELGADPSALRLSADRSRPIPLGGLAVSASTLHTVEVSVGGAPAIAATTGAATVAELLAAQGIAVGPRDRLSPAAGTPLTDGLAVSLARVAVASVSATRSLPEPAPKTVDDAALLEGDSKVAQHGRAGMQVVNYEVTTVNGKQTAKRELGTRTVIAAVATVTHVGTKAAPAVPAAPTGPAAPAVTAVPTQATTTFTYDGNEVFTNDTSFGVNWDGLAMCESTHNPQAINANPSAGLPTYGLFQFDLPTWESVGGSGNPIDATPQEQLMRAKLLYQQRGLEPWACRDAAH